MGLTCDQELCPYWAGDGGCPCRVLGIEVPEHEADCDDADAVEARFCPCTEPSGRDDPYSISNLMAAGPPPNTPEEES